MHRLLLAAAVLLPVLGCGGRLGGLLSDDPVAKWKAARQAGEDSVKQRKYADAEQSFAKALEQAKRVGPDAEYVAVSLEDLAANDFALNKPKPARARCEEALPILEKLPEGDADQKNARGIRLAGLLVILGRACQYEGDFVKAEEHLKRAINLLHEIPKQELPELEATVVLAQTFADWGRPKQAISMLERALDIEKLRHEKIGTDSLEKVTILLEMGVAQSATKDYNAAKESFVNARRVYNNTKSKPDAESNSPEVSWLLINTAWNEHESNAQPLPVTEQLLTAAFAILQKAFPSDSREVMLARMNLGQVLFEAKQYDRAEPHLKDALSSAQTLYTKVHPNLARALELHAALLAATNRQRDADDENQRAAALRKALAAPPSGGDAKTSEKSDSPGAKAGGADAGKSK